MLLIDKINLENELLRQSSFLKTIEQKLGEKRTYEKVRSKVWVMEKIGEINRKLYGKKEHQKEN